MRSATEFFSFRPPDAQGDARAQVAIQAGTNLLNDLLTIPQRAQIRRISSGPSHMVISRGLC